MRAAAAILATLIAIPCSRGAELQKVAALDEEGKKIVITTFAGGEVTVNKDHRTKSLLRWLPDGSRLSYVVRATDGSLGKLVIVDPGSQTPREVAIRPPTDPPTVGMRRVERIQWVSDRVVRVAGSITARNCEMFDLDIETGAESNGHAGACWSFVVSPDGKHVANRALDSGGSDDDHTDAVEIDSEDVQYIGPRGLQGKSRAKDPNDMAGFIQLLSGPVWAPDSARIAFVEKEFETEDLALSLMTLKGEITRVRLPLAGKLQEDCLEWITGGPVVLSGDRALFVDSAGNIREGTSDEVLALKRARQQRTDDAARTVNRVEWIVRRSGGRQGTGWPGDVVWPSD